MLAIFRSCGEVTGIKVVKDEARSDPYFSRSDNAAFASAGVPSTTLSVTYAFSDYHGAGDEWPKLNYENMVKVDCTIALAAYQMADSTEEPHWNAENPKTASYRQARRQVGRPPVLHTPLAEGVRRPSGSMRIEAWVARLDGFL